MVGYTRDTRDSVLPGDTLVKYITYEGDCQNHALVAC